jgi:hypothetical protein
MSGLKPPTYEVVGLRSSVPSGPTSSVQHRRLKMSLREEMTCRTIKARPTRDAIHSNCRVSNGSRSELNLVERHAQLATVAADQHDLLSNLIFIIICFFKRKNN